MWQMVFAYVLVQGWIIDPYEHWFFYQPGEVLFFPAHYTEIVDVYGNCNISTFTFQNLPLIAHKADFDNLLHAETIPMDNVQYTPEKKRLSIKGVVTKVKKINF